MYDIELFVCINDDIVLLRSIKLPFLPSIGMKIGLGSSSRDGIFEVNELIYWLPNDIVTCKTRYRCYDKNISEVVASWVAKGFIHVEVEQETSIQSAHHPASEFRFLDALPPKYRET